MSTRLLELVAMPARVARLPRNAVGYPIPWFVADLPDGTRDFRIAGEEKQLIATRDKLCWVCGTRLGAYMTFVIGPMCAVNRLSAEPPCHRDCATYSAQVCPFLVNPSMRRRPTDGSVETIPPGGEAITRNPGVALLWTTRSYRPFRAPLGHDGLLYEIGDPTDTTWLHHGRAATRAEILASIESGLPALREACQRDAEPLASLEYLEQQVTQALALVPREG